MLTIASESGAIGKPVLELAALRAYLEADLAFHQVIISAAGNRCMSRILNDTRLLVRVFTATLWQYDR